MVACKDFARAFHTLEKAKNRALVDLLAEKIRMPTAPVIDIDKLKQILLVN